MLGGRAWGETARRADAAMQEGRKAESETALFLFTRAGWV